MNKFIYLLLSSIFLFSCGSGEQSNNNAGSEPNVSDQTIQDSTKYAEPTKDLLMGRFVPSQTKGFSKVPDEMCSKPMYVQSEVLSVFVKMREAAAKDGINLFIVSGTRTFNDQKAIWERKWNSLIANNKDSIAVADEILKFSSMPGTSRHHWGTDIDLVSVDPLYFESEAGDRIYKWLIQHAHEYSFCQVYSNKEETGRTGYSMEKWHWSYMPISNLYLKSYLEKIKYQDINGFEGASLCEKMDVKSLYVNGINQKCIAEN